MLNIILADTDQDNIRNIRTYIKGTFANLKIVSVLTDHDREVIDVMRDTLPELIIADIRFFGNTGYVLIRDIHERYPDVRFIVYGYYNDSEYMEHSRDFGVLEYLYRPLRRAELSRCLHTAINYFEKADITKREEQHFENEYQKKLPVFRELFLRDLLNGHITGDSEIYKSFEFFQMNFEKGFNVFVLRIDNFKKLLLILDETEKHMLSFKMAHYIQEQLKNYRVETITIDFNTVVAVLGGYEDLDKMITLLESLKNMIFQQMNVRVTIGLGRTYDNPSEINISYREAESALRYRFHLGEDSIIPIHYMEPSNNLTYKYPSDKEDRLVRTAVIGEYNYCKVLLEEIFDSLREAQPLPEKLLPKLIMNILISINRYLSEQNISISSSFTSFFSSKELLRINNIDDAFIYLNNTLKNFCGFILDYHKKLDDDLINKAKNICEERYYETISLPKIAMELGATPEYINRLFIERENKSLVDYIMRIRLDEVKKLIRESELSDDIIAVKVGYEDGRQMRSIFRQYEGVNVSDYRLQYNTLSSQIGAMKRI
ncbi:MAG: helix-turn-helix domain-containing protein [Clostridiales bacterium]|jgi:two-component system response regulator YesN|nr:helix-turn-helix domain-containing protein [Clostridiales bacterium]